ncbi:MAG: hypothetical protein OSJ52_11165 [Lachnospiraceae bacterium]|nr:hypothetical protein [Lachnospiraceae bacterium]
MDKTDSANQNLRAGANRKKGVLLAALLLLSLFLWLGRKGEEEVREVARPKVGKRKQEVELEVRIGEKGENWSWKGAVAARVYSVAELEERLAAAERYIREQLPREGETLDQVISGLNLIEEVPAEDVKVSWSWKEKELLDRRGNVVQDNLSEETIVLLKAEIRCQDLAEWMEIPVCLTPESFSDTQQRQRELEQELTTLAAKEQETDSWRLPEEWEGIPLYFTRSEESSYWLLPLLLAGALLLKQAHEKEEERKREEKRKEEMLLQYPDLVSKFVVLMGAGMNLASVWQRVAAEYERRIEKEKDIKKRREALYEEVRLTALELQNGGQERAAYEAFGKRAGLPACQRFSSILTQNLRMGSERVLEQLEYEATQAIEERKAQARRRGEEMGTKLLLPMMLQLLLILVMVMIPAFISM